MGLTIVATGRSRPVRSTMLLGGCSKTSPSVKKSRASIAATWRGRSLNHLIRPLQERRRDRQAERLGGLHVDDQLELRGLLDGQVGGLGALEDLVHVGSGVAKKPSNVLSIGHKAPGFDII